jgi:hypothetical protein
MTSSSKPKPKYTLSKQIDTLIDRKISREFHGRLTSNETPVLSKKIGGQRDDRLRNFLQDQEKGKYVDLDKRISVQDLEKQTHNLYNECLIEFLRSRNIVLVAQLKDKMVCSFDNKPVMIHTIRYRCYPKLSALRIVMLDNGDDDKKEQSWTILPIIEQKIKDIAELVVTKTIFLPALEAAKTVRKKTPEERIPRDANGKVEFEEWDMYNYIRFIGMTLGRDIQSLERHIRTDFELWTDD